MLNKLKRTTKSQYYVEQLDKSKNDIKTTWNVMKMAMNKQSNKTSIPSIISHNTKITKNCKEIADAFCDYFTNVGHDYARKIPKSRKPFQHYLKNPNPQTMFLSPTDSEEILVILNNLKPKNSSGHDNLNSKFLKAIKHEIKEPLSKLINQSLTSGIFPDVFKMAEVVPIYKNKSRDELQNYRPISLLPTLSKILEKIIHKNK